VPSKIEKEKTFLNKAKKGRRKTSPKKNHELLQKRDYWGGWTQEKKM